MKIKDDEPSGYGKCPYGSASGTSGNVCRCDRCIKHRKKWDRRWNRLVNTLIKSLTRPQ